MKTPSKRIERITEWLQRQLSTLIQTEIRDPRLPKFITISWVKVSADLSHARVYFTVLTEDKKQVTLILNKAANHLRSLLSKISTLYKLPQLHFIYDDSIEYGSHLRKMITGLE